MATQQDLENMFNYVEIASKNICEAINFMSANQMTTAVDPAMMAIYRGVQRRMDKFTEDDEPALIFKRVLKCCKDLDQVKNYFREFLDSMADDDTDEDSDSDDEVIENGAYPDNEDNVVDYDSDESDEEGEPIGC